jgi:uncharacterized Zn finger protein (UPF0148 family)
MLMHCEQCGGRLERYEGETYCPDCTHYEAVEAHDRATDEALRVLAQDLPEPVVLDDEIPF